MDSLTHIVLGAAIGEVCLGKKIGYKAQIAGALACTVPDFDVFFSLLTKDEIAKLYIHRAYSHALFTQPFFAFIFSYISYLIAGKRIPYKQWYLLWILGLVVHISIDSCTTYGTQFFLPFSNYLLGLNNISIVDPLYTLPILILIVISLFYDRTSSARFKLAWSAIIVSTLYMGLTFISKASASKTLKKSLTSQNISYSSFSSTPTLFNNILWAGIAGNDSVMYCGEYSFLQKTDSIKWFSFNRNLSLEEKWKGHELESLKWFSQGQYILQNKSALNQDSLYSKSDTLQFFIIKWGRANMMECEPDKTFIFHFKLYRINDKIEVKAIQPSFKDGEIGKAFEDLWLRIRGKRRG